MSRYSAAYMQGRKIQLNSEKAGSTAQATDTAEHAKARRPFLQRPCIPGAAPCPVHAGQNQRRQKRHVEKKGIQRSEKDRRVDENPDGFSRITADHDMPHFFKCKNLEKFFLLYYIGSPGKRNGLCILSLTAHYAGDTMSETHSSMRHLPPGSPGRSAMYFTRGTT